MHLAEARHGGIGGGLQFGLERDVGADRGHIGIGGGQRGARGFQRGFLNIAEHHPAPGGGERLRDAQADPRCCAGYKRDLALKMFHRRLSLHRAA